MSVKINIFLEIRVSRMGGKDFGAHENRTYFHSYQWALHFLGL